MAVIGVYGGTFDPIHYGHLRTALEVKECLDLQQLRLIPCYQPMHRDVPAVTAKQRLHMLKLAIAEEDSLIADDRELRRGGPSYMVDTLQSLRDEMGTQALLLIIGSDAFKHITNWHQWRKLFELGHVVVMLRPGTELELNKLQPFLQVCYSNQLERLRQSPNGLLFFQSVTQLDISATQIRRIINENRNPRFLLPDTVINYIKKNQLYRDNVDLLND